MELREIVAIFQKQKNLFVLLVAVCVIGALLWQGMQPVRYQAELLINIGRSGVQTTSEYTYDSFYRLQADERFADTVVRWLSAPRVVEDIYTDAGLSGSERVSSFIAKRLSSQMITITYTSGDQKMLKQLSESLVVVLNRYTATLNTEGKEQGWFVVIGSDPVITEARVSRELALIAGLVVGVFVAFWIVLFRHYFSREVR